MFLPKRVSQLVLKNVTFHYVLSLKKLATTHTVK